MQPPNIVLVHGDSNEMGKLKQALTQQYRNKIQILCPRNCQKVRFNLISKKSAKIVGQMAKQMIAETAKIRDMLIQDQRAQIEIVDIPRPMGEPEEDVEMRHCEDNFIKIDGVMIRQDFDTTIMTPQDVEKFTPF